jgi:hypothetical protein
MCTMTWLREPGGYQVFFNRDERRTRRPARPPAGSSREGVRYLAPADGDFGGTWLAVNELGVTLALLNGYLGADDRPAEPGAGFISRGLLASALAGSRSVGAALERLEAPQRTGLGGAGGLARYRSFLLVLLEPDRPAALATWSGGRLTVERSIDQLQPLVSSSFDTAAVREERQRLFAAQEPVPGRPPEERHLAFHASHRPSRGPYSPCMHRPEARTVSFSHVRVSPGEVVFAYAPDSPCRARPADPPATLPRRD